MLSIGNDDDAVFIMNNYYTDTLFEPLEPLPERKTVANCVIA